MSVIKLLISIIGFSYLAACLVLFVKQRSFIYYPTPTQAELAINSLSIAVDNAVLKISVREINSPNAIIYFGGNAENVANTLPNYAKVFPNYALYFPHYRGYSGSTGQPTESNLHADADMLYNLVKTKHSHICVIGRSLGSGVATRLASIREVNKLILITPYDSILNLAKQKFPYFPISMILQDRFESWRYAPKVTAPTVILAAENDQTIPLNNSNALFKAFVPGIANLKLIKNTDHHSIVLNPEYFKLMQM